MNTLLRLACWCLLWLAGTVMAAPKLVIDTATLAPGGTLVMVGGSLKQVMKALLLGRFYSLGSKKVRSLSAKPSAEERRRVLGRGDQEALEGPAPEEAAVGEDEGLGQGQPQPGEATEGKGPGADPIAAHIEPG